MENMKLFRVGHLEHLWLTIIEDEEFIEHATGSSRFYHMGTSHLESVSLCHLVLELLEINYVLLS